MDPNLMRMLQSAGGGMGGGRRAPEAETIVADKSAYPFVVDRITDTQWRDSSHIVISSLESQRLLNQLPKADR